MIEQHGINRLCNSIADADGNCTLQMERKLHSNQQRLQALFLFERAFEQLIYGHTSSINTNLDGRYINRPSLLLSAISFKRLPRTP